MPYNLPHRKGYTVVHQHEQGEPCVINTQNGLPFACRYQPTLRARLMMWLHRG